MMKNLFLGVISVVGLASAENLANIGQKESLTGDFLTGFESGIFLR
tara:strand:+ start:92 stop:229 length:138 start_codon:yes stop_codon:yes gene_type:complete